MDATNILLIIVGGGAFGLIISRILSSKVKIKSSVLKSVHDLLRKQGEERVTAVEERQSIVKANIENKEKVSEVAKEKIKEIQKKAAVEIQEILKEDNIKKISKQIEDDWNDIWNDI